MAAEFVAGRRIKLHVEQPLRRTLLPVPSSGLSKELLVADKLK